MNEHFPTDSFRFTSKRGLVLVAVLSVFVFVSSTAWAERWTSLSGTKTISAKMVGLWGDSVVLQLDGGRRVTVNLLDLQAESRIQAQELARKQTTFRQTIVGEIQDAAAEAAAPAPTPLPKPEPAPTYVPFQTGMSVIDQLEWQQQQQLAGHVVISGFDALPPQYRDDVEELAKLSFANMDAAALQSILRSIHQIGDVIVTKQRWVFSHPKLAAMEPGSQETIKEFLLPLAGLIREGLDPAAFDATKFQNTPLRTWLMERDRAMAPYIYELMGMAGTNLGSTFELKSENDGVALVEVTTAGVKLPTPFVKIDGCWVPKQMADDFEKNIETAKTNLANGDPGAGLNAGQAAMLTAMIDPMISPMARAQSAEELHAAMEPLFAAATPAIGMLASMANMPMGRNGRGNSGDPYGDGGYDDMDYSMEGMDDDMGYGTEGMDDGMGSGMEGMEETYGAQNAAIDISERAMRMGNQGN